VLNAPVSLYIPHILVKYIFFGALQQQFLFPCHGRVSTNHLPNQFGAQSLPVVGVTIKYIVLVKYKAVCKRAG
jgi:hypothetical protein